MQFFLFLKLWPVHPPPLSPSLQSGTWHGNGAYCRLWTGAEWKPWAQKRYINYMAGRITRLCCCVNLPRALKAWTSEFTLGRRKKVLLWTELPPCEAVTLTGQRLAMMFTNKFDKNHELTLWPVAVSFFTECRRDVVEFFIFSKRSDEMLPKLASMLKMGCCTYLWVSM